MRPEQKDLLGELWDGAWASSDSQPGRARARFHSDLHTILDALPNPLSWATLSDGVIQFVNRAFTRTYGYALEDLSTVDRWINEAAVSDRDNQMLRGVWRGLWQGGIEPMEIDAHEIGLRCASGEVKTVLHRGIILPDAGIGIATFEDISFAKRAEEAMRRLALEDTLTSLANRRALMDRWQDATSTGDADLAILLIDIDGFKSVNDGLGHDIGDELLHIVASRIRSCCRAVDFPFRSGGDEFGVLVGAPLAAATATALASCIVASCSEPFALPGGLLRLSVSIGISLYPRHGADLREMMRRADEALYEVKRNGKNGWSLASGAR